MLPVTRNKCEWGRKQDDEADGYVNPRLVREGLERWEKEGEKRYGKAMQNARGRKGNSHSVPDFFHEARYIRYGTHRL